MSATRLRTLALSCIAALVACIVPGCAASILDIPNDLQKSFVQMISISDLNQRLRVELGPDEQTGPRFGATTEILVENVSDESIYFPVNPAPIRLYIVQGSKWVQISNEVTYMSSQGGNGFVLYPKAERSHIWSAAVRPSLGPIGDIGREPIILRTLVIGELMENGQRTGLPVGAYWDTLISPL